MRAAPVALALLAACRGVSPPPPADDYRPDRRDYGFFQQRHPELLEPNYLPFMLHRIPDPAGGPDWLVFCRWADASMPVAVYVEPPEIPEELQGEVRTVEPEEYVRAAGRALHHWESQLEGELAFERVASREAADLTLQLRAREAPVSPRGVQVLGSTEALLDACRVGHVGAGRADVTFAVPELSIYLVDEAGLLTTDQVERIALHEIGHALGMRGHSPIPADFMYPVVRERADLRGLSIADVNSFVSLYALPNGTVYGRVPRRRAPRETAPRAPRPRLSEAPHVDARRGFEIRTPSGWTRLETRHGFFSADGPIWDRDAALEIVVWPVGTVEEFMARFRREILEDRWLRSTRRAVVAGRPARVIVAEDDRGEREEELWLVELGDGRVMMLVAAYPVAHRHAWRRWFQATIASLEIWEPEAGSARP